MTKKLFTLLFISSVFLTGCNKAITGDVLTDSSSKASTTNQKPEISLDVVRENKRKLMNLPDQTSSKSDIEKILDVYNDATKVLAEAADNFYRFSETAELKNDEQVKYFVSMLYFLKGDPLVDSGNTSSKIWKTLQKSYENDHAIILALSSEQKGQFSADELDSLSRKYYSAVEKYYTNSINLENIHISNLKDCYPNSTKECVFVINGKRIGAVKANKMIEIMKNIDPVSSSYRYN